MREYLNPRNWFKGNNKDLTTEELKAFQNKGDSGGESKSDAKNATGEGIADVEFSGQGGFGSQSLGSFNIFYNNYLSSQTSSENEKIDKYREMAEVPEIADVVEDAVNEATQSDDDGRIFNLKIKDEKLEKNENKNSKLQEEFDDFFYNTLDIEENIWQIFYNYLVDGRVYYERIINENKQKNGIKGIKILPTKTMDFIYDKRTGKIQYYLQYLSENVQSTPQTYEEAKEDPNVIIFHPSQIGYIEYGMKGKSKKEIKGYLDKAKVPYNQLKWLETAVIIYRIVRAPERFVFKVDTGSMPLKKSMKFAEKVKEKLSKKVTYDPQSGELSNEADITGMMENFFLPQSADGRGSDVTTVGGSSAGFKELDDIYYFQKKLYQALKYPRSRVEAKHEGQSGDIQFNDRTGEIARDEIKWAKFLERQQNKICKEFKDLFMLHLQFKGEKKSQSLERDSFDIVMNDPNEYKTQMEQNYWATKVENYMDLANNEEFSKYFLMKEFLGWSDEKIKENSDGFDQDEKLGFEQEDSGF